MLLLLPLLLYAMLCRASYPAGMIDRMLASLRPSLTTTLLVLSVAGAFMVGGTGEGLVIGRPRMWCKSKAS